MFSLFHNSLQITVKLTNCSPFLLISNNLRIIDFTGCDSVPLWQKKNYANRNLEFTLDQRERSSLRMFKLQTAVICMTSSCSVHVYCISAPTRL